MTPKFPAASTAITFRGLGPETSIDVSAKIYVINYVLRIHPSSQLKQNAYFKHIHGKDLTYPK